MARTLFRHFLSGLFILAIGLAAIIVIHFGYPYIKSWIKDMQVSISPELYYTTKHLAVNNTVFTVLVSDNDAKRKLGLSKREKMEPKSGMLFIYEASHLPGIWMKDMRFPIDIIWIDELSRIVDIKSNIEPETYPQIFKATKNAFYVLEVNSGAAKENDINIGDVVTIY